MARSGANVERTTTTSAELTDSSREASARNMNPPNAAAYATLAAEEGTTPPRASESISPALDTYATRSA